MKFGFDFFFVKICFIYCAFVLLIVIVCLFDFYEWGGEVTICTAAAAHTEVVTMSVISCMLAKSYTTSSMM